MLSTAARSCHLPTALIWVEQLLLRRSPKWRHGRHRTGLRRSRRSRRALHLFALRFLLVESLGEVLQANSFITYTLGHDAVFEGDAGGAAAEFAHLESGGRLGADVEPLAVAVRSQEDVVFDAGIHGLPEDRLQVDACGSVDELGRACVFEPILRRLDGVGFDPPRALAAGGCNYRLQRAGAGSVTATGEGTTSPSAFGTQNIDGGGASAAGSGVEGNDRGNEV